MSIRTLVTWLFIVTSSCYAEPLRIDLGMDTGRNDTATPGWLEWQVPNGPKASREFKGIAVNLRAVGGSLVGQWHKAGLVSGATMATDGVTAPAIDIELRGLQPGTHSLVTYHNGFSQTPMARAMISFGTKNVAINPTAQATTNEAAESAYLEFEVSDNEPVRFRLTADHNDAVLNGIEIDGTNPKAKALTPFPTDGDAHVDGDSGVVRLSWRAAPDTPTYHVYLASAASEGEAQKLVSAATPTSNEYKGASTKTRHHIDVDPEASLLHYAWRVDAEAGDGKITRGDVWTFRVRRLAFPGAEGYGRFAIGGRGGRVLKVKNLNDSGPGSLRAAVEATGPRTVIFDVSGNIVVKDKLTIRDPYLTIAGQTAPGKGICISNYNMGLLGNHDCIIRFMRVRPGNTAGVTLDGMGLASCDHSIIDHCSISWTQDESFSSRGAKNVTLQRTLISEALNVAGHKKYAKGTEHGYAASIGGDIGSFHHNLLSHCAGRNWSLAGGLDKATRHAGRLDIRNNVVYNWGHRTTDGGAKEVNFVSNYYKPGPSSRVFHVLMPEREAVKQFGPQMYYAIGNVMEGRFDAQNQLEGIFERRGEPHENWLVDEPFYDSYVTTTTAEAAFKDVLSDVGCNQPTLDEHDRRVIDETLRGEARYKGSITGHPGLPDTQDDVGGWEDYGHETRPANWDPDNDGLPTWWETLHGMNPNSPAEDFADANQDSDHDGFTNLEDYLNWLALPHFKCRIGDSLEIDLAQYACGYDAKSRSFSVISAKGGEVAIRPGTSMAVFKPSSRGLASFTFSVADGSGDRRESLVNVRVVQ